MRFGLIRSCVGALVHIHTGQRASARKWMERWFWLTPLPRPGCERTMAVVFFEILAARRVALDRETDLTCATFTRPGETVGLDVRASSVVRRCRARRSEADDCPGVLSYERRQAS